MKGFITSIDGGSSTQSMVKMSNSESLDRQLCPQQALATRLGAEGLHTLLQPLLHDYTLAELQLYLCLDSLCTLSMVNPQINLKN